MPASSHFITTFIAFALCLTICLLCHSLFFAENEGPELQHEAVAKGFWLHHVQRLPKVAASNGYYLNLHLCGHYKIGKALSFEQDGRSLLICNGLGPGTRKSRIVQAWPGTRARFRSSFVFSPAWHIMSVPSVGAS